MKRVLVACEYSQVVTSAFLERGADAYSCDIIPTTGKYPSRHLQCDVAGLLDDDWDLVIAHPPCTMLAKSSAVAYSKGLHTDDDIAAAREFFMLFTKLKCPTCIENPTPMKRAQLPLCTQVIQPYEFGHPYSKRTCLWLYDLPGLLPMRGYWTEYKSWVTQRRSGKGRSRFWEGVAEAMAEQWLPII